MTIDTQLQESAGLDKYVHKYTYSGTVEQLAKGAKNTVRGKVTLEKVKYTVNRYQQTFDYNDMDVMVDPEIMNVLTTGAAQTMSNEIRSEYFAELEKISNVVALTGDLTYNGIVDAAGEIDVEVDPGSLFMVMGADARTAVRKAEEFVASNQGEIIYSGQFGTVAGIPCIFSKMVPAGTIYLTEKAAVKFFVKREGSVEQDRDIETKDNTVVYERHGLIALVDDTNSVKITFGASK
jgi:hypothetical protein